MGNSSIVKAFDIETKLDDFYQTYLKTINGILGLSNKEIEIFAELIKVYSTIREKTDSEEIANELLFSSRYRGIVRKGLDNISNLAFNNYIAKLKDKQAILEREDGFIQINPKLATIMSSLTKSCTFSFNFKIIEDEQKEVEIRTTVDREVSNEEESDVQVSPSIVPSFTGEEEINDADDFEILEDEDDALEL